MLFLKRIVVLLGGIALLPLLLPILTYGQTQPLSFRPLDAQYSLALDRIVMVSANPNQLHIYNASANSDVTVALREAPLSLSVSPDGYHAAVAFSAAISYVNLQSAAIEQTFIVTGGTGKIVLGASFLYILPTGTENTLTSVDLTTGEVTATSANSILARLDPVTNGLYGTSQYSQGLTRYDISSGPAGQETTAPNSGEYPTCGDLWFSPDGSRIYDGCATVFTSSNDSRKDMTYVTSFAGLTGIQSLTSSAALNRVAVIPVTQTSVLPYASDGEVRLFESSYLNPVGRFVLTPFQVGETAYQPHGHWIFFNAASSALYALTEADSTSGLLNDFAIQTFAIASPNACTATFATAAATSIAAGAIGSININADPNCIFTAVSNDSWITLVSGYYGSGNNTLSYLVRPNFQSQSRTGTISMGSQTLTITQVGASSVPPSLTQLSFEVVAADYSKGLDKLVLVASHPNELHIYDPITQTDQIVPLAAAPLSVSVDPTGSYAAVGHDGWISYVNLQTASVAQLFEEDTDFHSIVLAGNGYIYAFPKATGFDIYSLQISTGTWTPVPSQNSGGVPRLHASGKYLYVGAPYSASKWDIENGPPLSVTQNFNSTTCGNLWLSEDGNRMFTACGTVLRTSEDPNQDLSANGSFTDAGSVAWAAHSEVQQKVAVIPAANTYAGIADTAVQLYDYNSLTILDQTTLPSFNVNGTSYESHGRFLFWNAAESKLISLVQADSTAGLTSDYGVFVVNQPATLPACSYSLGTNSLIVGPQSGNGFFSITSATCDWGVATDASWIYLSGPVVGTGAGTVQFTIQANPTASPRTATITIGTQSVTVTQEPVTCSYTIGPSNPPQFDSSGASLSIFVATQSSCGWSAQSADSWLRVTSGTTGAGNGVAVITVDPNNTGFYRYGTVVVAGQQVYLTQSSTPSVASPLRFIPIAPCRVADTRKPVGPFGGPMLAANSTRTFYVPNSACGIPSEAQAYSLNATVAPSGDLGYLTMWPAGQSQPWVSTLNSLDGRIKANAAIVAAGSGGVNVAATQNTDFVLDINGYFVAASNPAGLAFYPLTPCRIVDTRNGSGSLAGGETRDVPVQSSACNVPAAAQAYSMNVTVVPKQGLSYLTTWPTGQVRPVVSTLNAPTGTVTANAAIIPAGTGGNISVFVTNPTDLVMDISGYFAPPAAGGLSLYASTPCRVLDTRYVSGAFQGEQTVNVGGSTCAPPANAQAYVLNATVVPSPTLGYLTLWADGQPKPLVSTLNALDGSITSNMAIVPTTNGSIDMFGSSQTQVILDAMAYFAP